MRMRRKKFLENRIDACSDLLLEMQCQGEHSLDPLDPSKFFDCSRVFGNNNPVHLEIGCGKGGFVLEAARRNPNINYIAIEKSSNVIVTGLESLKESGLTNIRFVNGQAETLTHLFSKHEIERIYLNFSCPYHKEAYAKKRLTYTRFLKIYKEILTEAGQIHIKTDNRRMFEFTLENLSDEGFFLREVSLDLHKSGFEENIVTEYEKMFSEMGKPIYRVVAHLKKPDKY